MLYSQEQEQKRNFFCFWLFSPDELKYFFFFKQGAKNLTLRAEFSLKYKKNLIFSDRPKILWSWQKFSAQKEIPQQSRGHRNQTFVGLAIEAPLDKQKRVHKYIYCNYLTRSLFKFMLKDTNVERKKIKFVQQYFLFSLFCGQIYSEKWKGEIENI